MALTVHVDLVVQQATASLHLVVPGSSCHSLPGHREGCVEFSRV